MSWIDLVLTRGDLGHLHSMMELLYAKLTHCGAIDQPLALTSGEREL